MTCYHPLEAYFAKDLNKNGKRNLVFNSRQALSPDVPIQLPCGQCIGCKLERSRQWAMRCIHESQMHKRNCWLTLTYNEENLKSDSLVKSDFQKFMKRLRKKYKNVRYYMCGEYGENLGRPHFHACIFGLDLSDNGLRGNDVTVHKKTHQGHKLYTSSILDELWPFGYALVGDLNFETAAYTARYITKKISGANALLHYTTIDPKGEVLSERLPEYTNMSLKPAIGKTWLEKYGQYIKDHDFVIMNGKKVKPPKILRQTT